jgi:predicted nucleic acid-binding protein
LRGWLLDTNVVSAIAGSKPGDRLAKWSDAQPDDTLYISILTLAEYRKGIENLKTGHQLRPRLEEIFLTVETRFNNRILPISNDTVLRWGAISGEVKRLTGHSPTVIDTMLAATAIENNLYLATRNITDVEHSGAAIFNPWKDDPADFPLF